MKKKTSLSLSPEAINLLHQLANRLGVSQASVIEMLIRERARGEQIEVVEDYDVEMPRDDEEVERFFSRVSKTDTCWEWIGTKDSDGYGQFSSNGRNVGTHRWSYRYHKGPIPKGYHVDHLCRNHGCVNPDHLEAVTVRENTLRGNAPSVVAWRNGTCKRGHPMTEDNIIIVGNGHRRCKACQQARNREYMNSKYTPTHKDEKRAYDHGYRPPKNKPRKQREFCKRGHPLAGDNIIITGNHRRCKACTYASNAESRRRRKLQNEGLLCH